MHCSANVGEKGDVAVFSAFPAPVNHPFHRPERRLIGDDEHGWTMTACLISKAAATQKLSSCRKKRQPEIYNAIRRDALLENVTVREDGAIDFDDGSKTENTRVSYPIYHIDDIVKPVSKAGHATKVIFLTATLSACCRRFLA